MHAHTDTRWQAIDEKLPPNDHARIVRRQVAQLDRAVLDQLYQGRGKVPSTHLSYLLWFSTSISREDEVLLRGKRKRGSTKRCSG